MLKHIIVNTVVLNLNLNIRMMFKGINYMNNKYKQNKKAQVKRIILIANILYFYYKKVNLIAIKSA